MSFLGGSRRRRSRRSKTRSQKSPARTSRLGQFFGDIEYGIGDALGKDVRRPTVGFLGDFGIKRGGSSCNTMGGKRRSKASRRRSKGRKCRSGGKK